MQALVQKVLYMLFDNWLPKILFKKNTFDFKKMKQSKRKLQVFGFHIIMTEYFLPLYITFHIY